MTRLATGGNGSGLDVDAHTSNYEGYGRVGGWHWRQKGVWTRVRSGEIAGCDIGDGDEI